MASSRHPKEDSKNTRHDGLHAIRRSKEPKRVCESISSLSPLHAAGCFFPYRSDGAQQWTDCISGRHTHKTHTHAPSQGLVPPAPYIWQLRIVTSQCMMNKNSTRFASLQLMPAATLLHPGHPPSKVTSTPLALTRQAQHLNSSCKQWRGFAQWK